jgi:hypothetical protein
MPFYLTNSFSISRQLFCGLIFYKILYSTTFLLYKISTVEDRNSLTYYNNTAMFVLVVVVVVFVVVVEGANRLLQNAILHQ